jgi:hypothetical protein
MKPMHARKPGGRASSSILACVKLFIVYPALFLLACIALLTPLAIGVFRSLIAGSLGLLAGAIQGLSTLFFGVISVVVYAIWLLLMGEWGRLVVLLGALIDWLRSFGLV